MDFKKIIEQLMHYLPAQIAPAIINLIIIMILTRNFTVELYGEYVLITTLITFSVTIFTQWLMQSILFYRPKYIESNLKNEFNLHLDVIINMFFIIGIVVLLLLIACNTLFVNVTLYIFCVLIILVQSIFTIEQVILQSDLQSGKYAKRIFMSSLLRLVGIGLLAMSNINLINVLLVISISYIVFILPKMKKYMIKKKSTTSTKQFLKTMLTYGLPMLGWFLSISIIDVADRLLIEYFHGSKAVGLYAGNYSIISAALALVFAPLTIVIHPLLMKLGVNVIEQKKKIEQLISKFTTIFFIVGLPIIVLVHKFRKEIAYLFLGEQYVVASDLITIVMLGIFLWNLAMVGHKGMEIINKTKVMLYFAIASCLTSLLLNIFLIKYYSYMGAAYGNMIAFSLYCLLVYVYSIRNIKWKWNLKEILLISCCSALMLLFVGLFNINLEEGIVKSIAGIILISLGALLVYTTSLLALMKMKLINIRF
ncbi:polysaccharide biosynthesis C-terminal domain-containing protein [Solibacillus sp. FSL R7-0668]|uniref:oligosaccharide flippase family protein n=1 Tax=Solibacillus sp. FSL R7-0668 TaxID=2921688 RepID=UPI0030FD1D88